MVLKYHKHHQSIKTIKDFAENNHSKYQQPRNEAESMKKIIYNLNHKSDKTVLEQEMLELQCIEMNYEL